MRLPESVEAVIVGPCRKAPRLARVGACRNVRHVCFAMAVVLLATAVASDASQLDLATVVSRAGRYAESLKEAAVVAEERYEQEARDESARETDSPTPPTARTVLRSDFMFVRVPIEGWLAFRDVFERDGETIRDRDNRLAQLFAAAGRASHQQALEIVNEGARFNVGSVVRNVNVPTLPLSFLMAAHRQKFTFKDGKADPVAPGRVIEFKETGRPTFAASVAGRNIPASGRLWVDEETGTIYRTELRLSDSDVDARVVVAYAMQPAVGLWLPARMEERYRSRKNKKPEVTGVATYSNFRRFRISTREDFQP